MNVWIAFALGAAAHVLAAITASYAHWRFHHLADPDADGTGFVEDLWAFGHWLMQNTADRLMGRRSHWTECADRGELRSNWS